MRFVGRGHPAIRATHAKTLELSPDPQITARATCILAVGTEAEPPTPLAGRVRIRIAAGGERFAFEADANPSWDPTGPAVVRRSPLRLPGTFATDATASATDLPRALVEALRNPDALVSVDVAPVPDERETTVLAFVEPSASALPASVLAERERAGRVIAQDDGARRLLGPPDPPSDGPRHRTLVVATTDLPHAPPGRAGRVQVIGLSARLAVAAASPGRGAVVLADLEPDVRSVLRRTPAAARLVLVVPAATLPDVLAHARDIRGRSGCVVAQELVHPVRIEDGAPVELASSADVAVCLDAVPEREAIDPAVRAAVDALVADGVATRTAARALAALTGWDRRRAYDAIVAWPRG